MMRRSPIYRLSADALRRFGRLGLLRVFAALLAGAPALACAQYSEIKLGEYLHSATAAANGGIYAGYDSIGFSSPSLYRTNTDWVDLPTAQGFNTSRPISGSATAISHDGSVVAGFVAGTTPDGVAKQVAAFWVSGVESVVPAPPDDLAATTLSATAVSGDGTTLLIQDGTPYSATVETYVYNITRGTFISLGFLGTTNHQTYATALSSNGAVVAGYSSLDNGNIAGFVWTASNGPAVLAIPASHPNTAYLEPTCISDDGTTIFGRLTEFNGWVGFRYNVTNGYQDLGDLTPSACTADGSEAVGIESLYFPAVWSVGNGGGFVDHLLTANGTPQGLGTLTGPVTISPDGAFLTASGPDAYLVDQTWYGVWQVSLPFPLKTAPIPSGTLSFSTDYQTTLTEPAGTLTQSAELATGLSPVLVKAPRYSSSFVLNADGSFSYTPIPGYISNGLDPEKGRPTDTFTYHLVSPNGTSSNAVVQINVLPPMAPAVADPSFANVTATSALLGGAVTDGGGATVTATGVVYAPSAVNDSPQIGGDGVFVVSSTPAASVFTVGVSNLLPDTTYSYAAFATNSAGIGYSTVDSFTTPANFQSWQVSWYGGPGNSSAASASDPYQTGVPNILVFAFLGPYQDPQTASLAQLPQAQSTGGNLFYDFFEPAGVSGVKYGAQSSYDLTSGIWQPVPDTGSGIEHVFSVPLAAQPQLFMRLTVTPQ